MESIVDTLRSLFPDFGKARRARRKIRQRYRENLTALERENAEVFTVDGGDYSPEYLPNWVEKRHVQADHLIQSNGSLMSRGMYRIPDDASSEVKTSMESVVQGITIQNYLSIFLEIIFILFVVLAISTAVFVGLSGIGGIISGISSAPSSTPANQSVASILLLVS